MTGNAELGDADLVSAYRSLVVRIARGTQRQLDLQCEEEDLIAFGFQGLLEAHRRFDASKGVQFQTFAHYRIRGAIIDGVRKMAFMTRRAHARLRAAEGSDLVSEAQVEERAGPHARADSEDSLAATDRLLGRLAATFVISALGQGEDNAPDDPEELLEMERQAHRLRTAVETLPEREHALLRGFYFEGRRFDEVAGELGISKSWASRLHTKALDRLRASLE